jgi:hypothetical protein
MAKKCAFKRLCNYCDLYGTTPPSHQKTRKPSMSCQRSRCLALRLITAKRLVRTKRVKRAKRTKLLLVTTISHRSWFGSSFAGYRADKSFVSRRRSKFVGHTPPRAVPPLPFLILILNPVSGGHATAKSFVSRRCSIPCFSRPPKRFR